MFERAHHIVPSRHDGLHVQVTREESNHAVGHNLRILDQDVPEIPNDSGIVSDFESGADSHLVTPASDHL